MQAEQGIVYKIIFIYVHTKKKGENYIPVYEVSKQTP